MDFSQKYPGIIDEDGKIISGTCFQSIAAEADAHAKKGQYEKAVELYTLAIAIHNKGMEEDVIKDNGNMAVPDQQSNNNAQVDIGKNVDKALLVSRSQCYLMLGDTKSSLEDSDKALKIDPKYCKAIYQKAETLYTMSDFEMALVFFHRGNQLRPELPEFKLGIHKAQEAINNAIGDPKNIHIQDIQTKAKKNLLKKAKNKKKYTVSPNNIFLNKTNENNNETESNKSNSLEKIDKNNKSDDLYVKDSTSLENNINGLDDKNKNSVSEANLSTSSSKFRGKDNIIIIIN